MANGNPDPESHPDPETLARLAIWARLFCASVRRPGRWSGYSPQEWSRLLELAALVDRRTVLRWFGAFSALMFCIVLICSGLSVTAIVLLSRGSPPPSPLVVASVAAAAGIGLTIAMLLAYRTAVDVAADRNLIDSLTIQVGDAELAVKIRRQMIRTCIGSVAAIVLMLFTLTMFSDQLRPFLDRWFWVIQLIAVVGLVDMLIRMFRKPRTVKPVGPADQAGGI